MTKEVELTAWWVEYVVNDIHGYAIGWRDADNMGKDQVVLNGIVFQSGAGQFNPSQQIVFYQTDVVNEGPIILGRKVTREEHEAWVKAQAEAEAAAKAKLDKNTELRGAEVRDDHDWGVGEGNYTE